MRDVPFECGICNNRWIAKIRVMARPEKMPRTCRTCKIPVFPKLDDKDIDENILTVKIINVPEHISKTDILERFDCKFEKIRKIDTDWFIEFKTKDQQLYFLSHDNEKIENSTIRVFSSRRDITQVVEKTEEAEDRKLKVYRFHCFDGSFSKGFALAVAETKQEAISRILLCWSNNMSDMMTQNKKILEEGKLEKDWELKDFFYSWNCQKNIDLELFGLEIKNELENSPVTIYSLEDCSMYQGGV